MKNKENGVANTLKILAVLIFFCGFVAGMILGRVETTTGYYFSKTETTFSFARAAIYWISTFIAGMLFYGLGEIIQLLSDIQDTQWQKANQLRKTIENQTQQLCTTIEALASTPDGETETPPQA